MGTDIHDWVEACPDWADEEDGWLPLINAGLILGRDYDTFRRLFGVRMSEESAISPLAAQRGLPANVSEVVRETLAAASSDDTYRYLDGWICFHSASWLTWAKVQSLDWSELGIDYQTLFHLMQVLADWKHYVDLRLVVWFDN